MNIKSVELEIVCGPTSKLPVNLIPEIAFAGKSNVGKSSLINTLINRKGLARTSSQPGKTQTINFYNVNKALYFVDLPGYGFAKASKDAQIKWGQMIEKYLKTSKQLKAVFLLIDIRHEVKSHDKEMFDWVRYNGFEPIIIVTKLDKIKRSQVAKQIKVIKEGLLEGCDESVKIKIIPFSAETRQGKEDIWAVIEELISE